MTKVQTSQATKQLAQDEIARSMLQVWACSMSVDRSLNLSQKRKDALNFLFAEVFNCSLKQWEQFADLIGGSGFLQTRFCKRGELFDWATRLKNCLKILNCVGTAEYITDELAERLLAEAAKEKTRQSQSISLGQSKKSQAESALCKSFLRLTNIWPQLPLNRDHYSDERHFGLVKNSHLWYCWLKVMKFMGEIKKPEVFTPQAFKSIN